jgi:flagellar motor switch protein FliN/FliY
MAEEKEKQPQENQQEQMEQPEQQTAGATEEPAAAQQETAADSAEKDTPEATASSQDFFDTEVGALHVKDDSTAPAEVGTRTLELLYDLELPVSVELARKDLTIREILTLTEGAILEFDKMAGESVDILVNNKKIAEGEVVVVDDRFGVRITSLVEPGERIHLGGAGE